MGSDTTRPDSGGLNGDATTFAHATLKLPLLDDTRCPTWPRTRCGMA